MTRYQLWKAAKRFCPTISESAVYEYLRGQRQLTAEYIEAVLLAADLRIAPTTRLRKSA